MNEYLLRRQIHEEAMQKVVKDTYMQFMVDMFSLALNDPEIMGKDVFGCDRLRRVMAGVMDYCDKYHPALTKDVTADYCRAKLDENLARICGDALIPFERRYEWIAEIRYKGRSGK